MRRASPPPRRRQCRTGLASHDANHRTRIVTERRAFSVYPIATQQYVALNRSLVCISVQHLFDAYVAGLFARVWNDFKPCRIRFVSDNFPDAQFRDDKETRDLEITLVDRERPLPQRLSFMIVWHHRRQELSK